MEKCKHVSKIRPAWDHSILNPEKWLCYVCKTTESVWACLSCSNVACGRFNEKHALLHYQESKHPISIEVNDKYVYCYACDDYVLNDNAAGDLNLLRSALSAIATQKFTDIESRGRRLLRSYSHTGIVRSNTDDGDKLATAVWHERQTVLARVFTAWRTYYKKQKTRKVSPKKKPLPDMDILKQIIKKRTLIPGVTGLRNLGNTCYMNSILQVLSHIQMFREFFLSMKFEIDVASFGTPQISRSSTQVTISLSSGAQLTRQSTVECFEYQMTSPPPGTPTGRLQQRQVGGLNGGATPKTPSRKQLICDVESPNSSNRVWLCGELHGLLRVLWSGKWAQVSPHAFLQAVWQAIPNFKGYAQHDAQEFLCELLDKVQRELDAAPVSVNYLKKHLELLSDIFQGQLVSQVTCLSCGNVSQTFEPYMDLSLEFPNRYQITSKNPRVAQDICHITEMLAKFTEEEHLEGEIYACEKCNSRRRSPKKKTVYTQAKKQLLINKLPHILRLHLKRFRWSGRHHREKISTHVATDEILDLKPFCSDNEPQSSYSYQLFGVVIHHGRGFGSGHYTAYTWNDEAASWVHCNDSRMILSHLEDVLKAQAYILFYRQHCHSNSEDSFPSSISRSDTDETYRYSLKSDRSNVSLDSEEVKYEEDGVMPLLSEDTVQTVDKEISFRFKAPVTKPMKNQNSESALCTSSDFKLKKPVASTSSSRKTAKRSLDNPDSGANAKKKARIPTPSSSRSNIHMVTNHGIISKSFQISCAKLDDVLSRSSKTSGDKLESQSHPTRVKRRKSTFW